MSWWWISAWVCSVIVTAALSFCLGAAYEYLTRAMRQGAAGPDRAADPVPVVKGKRAA